MRQNSDDRNRTGLRGERGFSIMEMLVAMCIFLPLMVAAADLFRIGAHQYSSEQDSIEVNQDATAGFNMMIGEIAQAGSHSDRNTTITAAVTGISTPQAVPVASSEGFNPGDYVHAIDASGNLELVRLESVGSGTLTGIFLGTYSAGDPVRLFAMPYKYGILPPAGLAADVSADVTTLRFFGEINGDGTAWYAEYDYDSANGRITRSITPFGATAKGAAVPLITGIGPGSAGFTLHSDSQAVVTAVTVSLTVQGQWTNQASEREEIRLRSRVTAPSVAAASMLFYEAQRYGGLDTLPTTPPFIASVQYLGN